MKKLNNLGFTLIELLAVITIMGILMMVAVPSVSRTIENSRRDTFADNVLTYINTVRNAVLADEIRCCTSATDTVCDRTYSATPSNYTYWFRIDTNSNQTKDLMEKVATSSWGGARLRGYVIWTKKESSGRTRTTYAAYIGDATGHGMKQQVVETSIGRSVIYSQSATKNPNNPTVTATGSATTKIVQCYLK